MADSKIVSIANWGDVPVWAYSAVATIMESLKKVDPATCDHCFRVGEYCRLLAKSAGLNEYQQKIAEFSGILHDVGKIGIPTQITRKPGKLEPEEYSMMKALIVALTFTPALCATLLKQHDANKPESNNIFARFFRWFNNSFEKLSVKYQGGVNRMTHHKVFSGVVYLLVIAGLVGLYKALPSSFLPDEDQGVVMTLVQLPPSASLERTDKVITTMTDYFMNKEKEHVESIFTVSGFSFTGVGQNAGLAFIKLKDWSERTSPESQIGAIIQRGMALNMIVKDASYIMPLQLPAMPELGVSASFDIQLKDASGQGHEKLIAARNAILN